MLSDGISDENAPQYKVILHGLHQHLYYAHGGDYSL
jgi:hypothetical protein